MFKLACPSLTVRVENANVTFSEIGGK